METSVIYKALSANTTTGGVTSSIYPVGGADRIGFLFNVSAHTSGNTVFTVNIGMQDSATASPIMVACNRLLDNATTTAYVSSKTISTNSSVIVWLDSACAVSWVSVTATTSTDGAATAYILCEFSTPS